VLNNRALNASHDFIVIVLF